MSVPQGWHSITPRLIVHDPKTLVDFLAAAFDADVEWHDDHPSIVRIGDSIVMVSDGGGIRRPTDSLLMLYVDDCDATFAKAKRAGATVIEEPKEMPWGDRRAILKDPSGNDWQIATPHS